MAVVKVPISKSVTGHKALRDALRDTTTYSSDLQGDADVRDYRQIPLEIDPPAHHLYRAALSPFFVKPKVEKFESAFISNSRTTIKHYFSTLDENTNMQDGVMNLALPVVMANLGSFYNREQDVEQWLSWGKDVWTAGGPNRDGSILHQYLDRIYEESLTNEKQDIWSEISHLQVNGMQISEIEFRGIAGVMLAGGRDTVVKLISGILWYFGENQLEFDEFKQNPDLIDTAVTELLRYLTPNTSMARTLYAESTTEHLPPDRYVMMDFLSANFDPEVYPEPWKVNLKRSRNPHLSFGYGPHTCIGNHLAEIEARAFIKALLMEEKKWSVSNKSEIDFYPTPLSNVPQEFKQLILNEIL
jgi:cytochrome P450